MYLAELHLFFAFATFKRRCAGANCVQENQCAIAYISDQLAHDPHNKLKILNEKLEFKAQVLETLMPATRLDPKV